jgi:putative ATP-dependent endonuclease of OLD family
MEALRDVEGRLAAPRTSPLQQIIDQRRIPEAEQAVLVGHMQTANANINASATIGDIGTQLSTSFGDAAGQTFAMGVSLGLSEATFADISRGLKVLLSGYGLTSLDPSRNGLGLNNILYISMLQHYFECRVAEARTAGQILLVEEPEAHLHPQLQRVLLATLQRKTVQVFITTHSTHITSGVPLSSQIILTSSGGAVSTCVKAATIPGLEHGDIADLERYLDATRSSLLYARRVLLVEGPAEQFVIPRLVKSVMNVDLDEAGIAVVPIFGTHFKPYARLFGAGGIDKRCAVLTDGDQLPSDAEPEIAAEVDETNPGPTVGEIDGLRGTNVEVFRCETTFEREITLPGTLVMLEKAVREIGSPGSADYLRDLSVMPAPRQTAGMRVAKDKVLRVAKRFGKGRFAQLVSKYTDDAVELPDYIREAVEWLMQNAAKG